jgi:hypothetical protein
VNSSDRTNEEASFQKIFIFCSFVFRMKTLNVCYAMVITLWSILRKCVESGLGELNTLRLIFFSHHSLMDFIE